jgi:oxysterol-binding protein-related protein 8
LFNAREAKPSFPKTRPLEEQHERESERLWKSVTDALHGRDQKVATEEKSRIEDEQRNEAKRRADEGIDWRPRLFRRVQGGPGGSEEGEEDLEWIINTKM